MEGQRGERTLLGDYLVGIHLLISVASAIVIWARILEIAGCSDQCDYPLIGASTRTFWWVDLVLCIVAVGSYIHFRIRIRRVWIIPASGIALVLVGFLVANNVLSGALG
jgi:hydrogenase/urease accessory protein HupE